MDEPKQNFVEVAKERYHSESSPWWGKVAVVAGPVASGMGFVMTMDGIPKWTRYIITFVIGVLTYYVPKKFGTTNQTIARK